jgi:hypothetical protein
LLTAALTWSGAASASDSFPEALVEAAEMGDCTPGCSVCHRDNNGGPGTAIKKFASAMVVEGLRQKQPETVKPAVEALRTKNSDVDDDMKFDIDELAAGQDPNVPTPLSVCLPTYGFGCAVTRVSPPGLDLALLGSAALLVFMRRRSRR